MAFGQQLPHDEVQKLPKCEQRNIDFQSRRAGSSFVNYGKLYYEAEKASHEIKLSHAKAENQWTPIGPFGKEDLAGMGRINSMQFHPTDTNTWYICVAQGGLWKTTNAGKSWTSISGDLPILRTSYLSVHPDHPDTMYVALGDFAYLGHNLQANENKRNSHYGIGVYKTTDGGEHWTATGLSFDQTDFEGSLIAKVFIHPTNYDKLIAVGQTGSYTSDDAGKNWSKSHSGLFWDLEQHPNKPDELIASTGYVHSYGIGEAGILRSTDFGKTWQAASTTIPKTQKVQRIQLAYAPSDPTHIYALACDHLGGFYAIYKSTNSGSSYQEVLNSNYEYNILNNSLDDRAGGQGRYDLALTVDRNDKNRILTGGINMWQSTDGGKSFKPVTYWLLNYYDKSMHADIHQIVQHPTNNTYFACHDGGLSRTFKIIPNEVSEMKNDLDASTEWVNYTNGLNITSFYRLSVNQSNGSEYMAGAQDNSTVYGNDTIFFNLTGGDGMEALFHDDAFYRYTSSQNGRVYVFLTAGNDFSWEGELSRPSGELAEWTTPFVGANKKLYILYGNLWTAYGSFHDEKLTSFNRISGRTYTRPGTALAVEKANGKRIYLAKRGYASDKVDNEVWTSWDEGVNWKQIDQSLPRSLYPSYIEMSQEDPNSVWITFSGFDKDEKVFHSENGGDTWTNITYDLPNIPVNCVVHQNDGSDIIYIGTDLGVYYLMKDSTSWKPYNTGFPKVIVSELEIDTTNKKLVAATFGRGLWEVDHLAYTPSKDTTNTSVQHITKPEIVLSPNPVRDVATIHFSDESQAGQSIKIIDIAGREVLETRLSAELIQEFDVSHLLTGEYFIILQGKTGRSVLRFMKE